MKKEMLVFRFDELINAPIDVVFDYVDDDEKIKLWNTLLIENVYENEEDRIQCKPGTKFKTVQMIEKKTITVDSVLVEYEAPHKIIIHSTTKEGVSITKYLLSREHTQTRLIVESSIIPSNLFYKLSTKMFAWAGKIFYEEQYKRLIEYVENEVEDY